MMGGYGYGIMNWGWIGMPMMLIFWGTVIGLAVWGFTALTNRRPAPASDEALEVLKRRYAAGEISEADYEQAKKALGKA